MTFQTAGQNRNTAPCSTSLKIEYTLDNAVMAFFETSGRSLLVAEAAWLGTIRYDDWISRPGNLR